MNTNAKLVVQWMPTSTPRSLSVTKDRRSTGEMLRGVRRALSIVSLQRPYLFVPRADKGWKDCLGEVGPDFLAVAKPCSCRQAQAAMARSQGMEPHRSIPEPEGWTMEEPLLMTGTGLLASAQLDRSVVLRFCRVLAPPPRPASCAASRTRVRPHGHPRAAILARAVHPARGADLQSAVSWISNPLHLRNTPRCTPRRGVRRAARRDRSE